MPRRLVLSGAPILLTPVIAAGIAEIDIVTRLGTNISGIRQYGLSRVSIGARRRRRSAGVV
jgi:hypothetical protein